MATRTKDPLFGAAVLKLSFLSNGGGSDPSFRFVYEGVLRDLNLEDADVDRFIEGNREALELAIRGKAK